MPKSARNAKSIAYDEEKPLRKANSENQRIEIISGRRRPHLIGGHPGEDPANQAREQRDRPQCAGERAIHGERLLNVNQNERENGEVEGVEHPAKEGRPEGAAYDLR